MQRKTKALKLIPILTFAGILAAIAVYFSLFLDPHLRFAMEKMATKVNGAEVNIGAVKTSFLDGSVSVTDLEFTDAEKPERNRFTIGELKFQMLWDALLRGKAVIETAEVRQVAAKTPRTRPGYVLPPEVEAKEGGENLSALQKAGETLKRLEGLLGKDSVVHEFKDFKAEDLPSVAEARKLEAELAEKEKQWQERLKELPDEKDFKADLEKIKALQGGKNDPQEVLEKLQTLQKTVKEAKEKSDTLKSAYKDLKNDLSTYSAAVKNLPELAKKDKKDLLAKLKLPDLDMQSLAREFFGAELYDKIMKVYGYFNMARSHMSKGKSKEAKPAAKSGFLKRLAGEDHAFPSKGSYPTFWLKNLAINSKASPGTNLGNVTGRIQDVATNQNLTGKPTTAHIAGDFPGAQVKGFLFDLGLDYRSQPTESLKLRVGSLPVVDRLLTKEDNMRVELAKADLQTEIAATRHGEDLTFNWQSRFNNSQYQVTSSSEQLAAILKDTFTGFDDLTVDASATGSINQLTWDINSNLIPALQAGLNRATAGQIEAQKQKVDALVDKKLNEEREKLMKRLAAVSDKLEKNLGTRIKLAENVDKELAKQMQATKDKANPVNQGLDKAAEELKKRFKF